MSGEGNAVLVIVAIILVCLFLFGPLEWLVGLFLGTCLLQVVMVVVLAVAAICVLSGKK
jgi:hypothetical protein